MEADVHEIPVILAKVLKHNDGLVDRVKYLRKQFNNPKKFKSCIMDVEAKRQILTEIALDPIAAAKDRLNAIKIDNQLDKEVENPTYKLEAGDKLLSLLNKVRAND